jgi:hypothetical protein
MVVVVLVSPSHESSNRAIGWECNVNVQNVQNVQLVMIKSAIWPQEFTSRCSQPTSLSLH